MEVSDSVTGLRTPEHLVNSILKCCEGVETVERKGVFLKLLTLIFCSIYCLFNLLSVQFITPRHPFQLRLPLIGKVVMLLDALIKKMVHKSLYPFHINLKIPDLSSPVWLEVSGHTQKPLHQASYPQSYLHYSFFHRHGLH